VEVMAELKPYSFPDALAQIESCGFECEAGPLENNVAWRFLTAAAKVCPEYLPGQGVWFEVEKAFADAMLAERERQP